MGIASRRFGNKAQVAIFIIVGLVIVIAIYLIAIGYMSSQKQNEQVATSAYDYQGVKDYIISCLQGKAIEGAVIIGEQGGYYNLPQLSTKGYVFNTAYHIYGDQYLVPTTDVIQTQLATYMDEHSAECVQETNDAQKDIVIRQDGNSTTTVEIRDSDVAATVVLPLSMKKNDAIHKEDTFAVVVPGLRLKNMADASKEVADAQLQNESMICISCLTDIADKYNYTIDFMRSDGGDVFYQIIDNNYLVDNQTFLFTFAHKYKI